MASDAFLKLDKIKGGSQHKGHEGEIEVLSWSWGASQLGGSEGKPAVYDLSITKFIDNSTTALLQHMSTGKPVGNCELTVSRTAGKGPVKFFILKMNDCYITSLATGGQEGEEKLTDTISIHFSGYTLSYTPIDPKGSPKGAVDSSYKI